MSLTTGLSKLIRWVGQTWRGRGYFVLEQTLAHERAERKREYDALWQIFIEEREKSEAERQALLDRILQIRGVAPVHQKSAPRPPSTREFGPEGAIREAKEEKARQQAEMARKAEAWKQANLNGTAAQGTKPTQAAIWEANFTISNE